MAVCLGGTANVPAKHSADGQEHRHCDHMMKLNPFKPKFRLICCFGEVYRAGHLALAIKTSTHPWSGCVLVEWTSNLAPPGRLGRSHISDCSCDQATCREDPLPNDHRTRHIMASALRQADTGWVIPTVASVAWSINEVFWQVLTQGLFKLKSIIDIHAVCSLPAHGIKQHRRFCPGSVECGHKQTQTCEFVNLCYDSVSLH